MLMLSISRWDGWVDGWMDVEDERGRTGLSYYVWTDEQMSCVGWKARECPRDHVRGNIPQSK